MKLITKLGIYALVFASCFSLQAKEDALLETQKNEAEAIVQQIRDFGKNKLDENATGREFTHLLWEAANNYHLLSAESKLFIDDEYLQLPKGFSDNYVSEDGYFRIWFQYNGDDAIEDVDEDNNGVPDLVYNYARYLMDARAKYVDFGLKMPHSNSTSTPQYYIYISNSRCNEGVYGYTAPLDVSLSARSYVVVRSDYSDFGWGKPLGFKDSTAVKITLAHEFQHSIQMGYANPNMSMYLKEGCAVWSEQFVYDGEQDPFGYIKGFLEMSYLGVNYDARAEYSPIGNTGKYNLYPYGSWVFFKYLTDMYGNQIIKELYDALATPNRNEMVAFDLVLAKYGTNYAIAAKNFYTAMIKFPSNPDTKPIYFSRGSEIVNSTNSSYNTIGAFLTYTYNTNDSAVFTVNTRTNKWAEDKKIFKKLSSRYFRIITDRNGTIELTPEKTTDSLVLIIYQFKKTGGDHTKFKVSEVKAFGNSTVSLNYTYDPELPDVYIQLFNYKRQYTKVLTSWDMERSTTYYQFKIIRNATNDVEDNSTPVDFSLENIYPMPATDNAIMNLNIGTPAQMTYRIFDASGRTVSNNSFFANAGQMKYDLNLNGLTAGVYFLEVSNGIKSEKINFIVK